MITHLLTTIALASSPWIDVPSDIEATGTVAGAPGDVFEWLLDLENYASIVPEVCANRWAFGATTRGIGAIARVSYVPSIMNRRLTVELTKADAPGIIEYDHLGNRGFITRWTFTPSGNGTTLTLTTYIEAPGWPFRELYHLKVKPVWEECYAQAIARVGDAVPQPSTNLDTEVPAVEDPRDTSTPSDEHAMESEADGS